MAHNHLADIKAGTVTKTNVIGIRKALNAASRTDNNWSNGCTSPRLTWIELDVILSALHSDQPIVTGELHETGVAQLTSKRYRKQLSEFADVIADIDHFRLVAFEPIDPRETHWTPIYRCIGANGHSFAFRNVPWQSGGNGPEIVT